jgi:SAM-dependent methyltransferase
VTPKKLNLGCGLDYREGWVNADVSKEVRADVHFDAFAFPWPLPSGHFEEVLCQHIVEHIPHQLPGVEGEAFFRFFEELHRILAPGGSVFITVPHWTHPNAIVDPTHTRVIHPETFQYFDPAHFRSYYTPVRFRTESVRERRHWGPNYHLNKYLGFTLPFMGKKFELDIVLRKL